MDTSHLGPSGKSGRVRPYHTASSPLMKYDASPRFVLSFALNQPGASAAQACGVSLMSPHMRAPLSITPIIIISGRAIAHVRKHTARGRCFHRRESARDSRISIHRKKLLARENVATPLVSSRDTILSRGYSHLEHFQTIERGIFTS